MRIFIKSVKNSQLQFIYLWNRLNWLRILKSRFYQNQVVTILHYLAVAVAELDYFETCGFLLLRHNADFAKLFSFVAPFGQF